MNIKNSKKKQFVESESSFSFEFGGDNDIDAETFSTSIDNVIKSIRYITVKNEPEAFAKLKIKSVGTGSFDIVLSVIVEFFPTLLSKGVLLAATVIEAYLAILEIKKHLKGEKPKLVSYNNEQAEIINYNDESLFKSESIAKTYFENNYIDNLTVNMFKVLDNDSGRHDLIIKENGQERIKIEKEEYGDMSKELVSIVENTNTMSQIYKIILPLKKPDLLGNSKWEFIHNKIIEAEIKDDNFKQKVQEGKIKTLYAGVKIPVKLLLEQELDEKSIPIKDTDRYTVLEVIGDIIEPDQQSKFEI